MLEVKNLFKEYKTKKGVTTKALDNVSLTFPEKGMVFILGKSGSGKSTLLNVCGGLDKYDSGEIIIKGKSSKSFSGSDFDSYRNTYVGFVFQEYNILDGFSVEENIGLALELQNKKRDKATIDKILADVDMTDFASRRPNTLSGGQKQRVAIARALVKEPEIIMADEPTGALDSKTGQQVFDTLKKLSKDKLVLIVSHDRDFAEQYADRIIELKDGKVISDMTREEIDKEARNVRYYGTDTVCVTSASEITDEDLQSIKRFLQKTSGTAVISTSREEINHVKENVPELDIGEFRDIKAQPKSKEYPAQKMIRSKFPLRHAIRMGGSSLKTKPVRLVFTLLLSVMAFILFGLVSTVMFFDQQSVTKETLMSSDYSRIALGKSYYFIQRGYEGDKLEYEHEYDRETKFTLEEYEEIKKDYPGAIASIELNGWYNIQNLSMTSQGEQYYTRNIFGVVLASDSVDIVEGRAPTAADEVAISEYMYDGFTLKKGNFTYPSSAGVGYSGQKITLNQKSDVIYSPTNPVMLEISGSSSFTVKVVGVYKGDEKEKQYEELEQAARENSLYDNYQIKDNWDRTRRAGLYSQIMVSQQFIDERLDTGTDIDFNDYFNYSQSGATIKFNSNNTVYVWNAALYGQTGKKQLQLWTPDGTSKVTALSATQVGIPYTAVGRYMAEELRNIMNNDTAYSDFKNQKENEYRAAFEAINPSPVWPGEEASQDEKDQYEMQMNIWWQNWNNYRDTEWAKDDTRKEETAAINVFNNIYSSTSSKLRSAYQVLLDKRVIYGYEIPTDIIIVGPGDVTMDITLGGIFYEVGSGEPGCAYYGQDVYDSYFVSGNGGWSTENETKYEEPEDAFISQIYIPYDKTSDLTESIVKLTGVRKDDDSFLVIRNPIMDTLRMIYGTMDMMGTIFLYVGIALAAFSFLLMFNFISASISAKKKEIGILRAIGARGLDVFKIFMSEAMIIALICIVVAIGGTFALCMVINSILVSDTPIQAALFVFGPMSVVFIAGIAVLTALISTLIPVITYSRKPPISSIRAL